MFYLPLSKLSLTKSQNSKNEKIKQKTCWEGWDARWFCDEFLYTRCPDKKATKSVLPCKPKFPNVWKSACVKGKRFHRHTLAYSTDTWIDKLSEMLNLQAYDIWGGKKNKLGRNKKKKQTQKTNEERRAGWKRKQIVDTWASRRK